MLLWIAVYWWWGEGGGSHLVSFDSSPPRPVNHEQVIPELRSTPAPRRESSSIRRDAPDAIPAYRTYVPLEGESWESIALEQLGDEARVDALKKANPLRSGGPIQGGREIKIPIDPTNIQGRSPGSTEASREPEPAKPAPAQPTAPKPEALQLREYTVRDQDTLGEISKRFYGTTRHWQLIYDHNKARLNLASETAIREGHVLQIPPLPEGQG